LDLKILNVLIDGGIMEDNKNIIELERFIEENSGYWDLTDVKEFLLYHKDEIIKILQKL
jgi:hypothetical protein